MADVRLLLDEHFDRAIAEELRLRGHDVAAVTERDELVGSRDESLLDIAVAEKRVLVTRDYSTVRPLLAERFGRERTTWGVIFVPPSIPEGSRSTGRLIASLDALLAANPDDAAFVDREVWLGAKA